MRQLAADVEAAEKPKEMEKHQTRRWKTGDIYSPHDLSPAEMRKWKKRQRPQIDVFDTLAINPLHEYKVNSPAQIPMLRLGSKLTFLFYFQNFSIMAEYMSETGRILHSNNTGLRPVNQRRIAKAIRRAIGIGLVPSVHKHPQLLEAEAARYYNPRLAI